MAGSADLTSYKDALMILGTAGVVVPVLSRYKVSPVLAYLIAGAVLSPKGLGLLAYKFPAIGSLAISSPQQVAKFAEMGVVFLLFLIGLELSFERLMTMRRLVFGLGAAQVVLSAVLIAVSAMIGGVPANSAIVIGAALALSSTAIVVEQLSAQKRLSTATGRASFSILLFQDLAVVPILFMLSVLDPENGGSLVGGLLKAFGQAAGSLAVIVLVGRFLLQPLFRLVAQTGNHDMFIATTLFVAVSTSLVTAAAGLSMALGAFVAGLVLAETEYRRVIQTIIEPLKTLLLGVFFFSVGLSLDLGVLLAHPFLIMMATSAMLILKGSILFMLLRVFGISIPASIETSSLLAPGGEFAFVILTLALSYGLVAPELTSLMLTAVALSMGLIPIVGAAGKKWGKRHAVEAPINPRLLERPTDLGETRAVVVGYGRVGQLVCEMLKEHKVPYIAVDRTPNVVSDARDAGEPVYFGDVRELSLLQKCGLDTAKAAIITSHTEKETDEIVQTIRAAYPNLVIVARAKDAAHARSLYKLGVTDAVPETIEASLQLSEAALVGLGVPTGYVIASIHEKRDTFRTELQGAAKKAGTQTRAFPRRSG
ncbi:MAG: cation:proton antiporter [Hyphomicrobium sp.]|nr:cation:proton antiporter [Hyphomicrobium sp.]